MPQNRLLFLHIFKRFASPFNGRDGDEKKQDGSVEGHFQVTLVRGQNVQPNLQNSSSSSMSLIVFCIDISISAPLDPQILTAICQGEDDAPGTASLLSSHQKKKISSWTPPWQTQKRSREACHLLIKECSRGLTEAFCTVQAQPRLWHIWVMSFTKGILGSVPNQLLKSTQHTTLWWKDVPSFSRYKIDIYWTGSAYWFPTGKLLQRWSFVSPKEAYYHRICLVYAACSHNLIDKFFNWQYLTCCNAVNCKN